MFWEDKAKPKQRAGPQERAAARTPPPVPDTGWETPTTFPDLSSCDTLCIDTETFDPNLLTRGPGWATGDGHMVGLAVGTLDGHQWYFPMRHEHTPEDNMDPAAVIAWAKDTLEARPRDYVGANLAYDFGWLDAEGVQPNVRKLFDVIVAEPLIDEFANSYSLEALSQKYLGEGKVDDLLYDWLATAYGGLPTRKGQAKNIYRAPPKLVGPYAQGDVRLPADVFNAQRPILEREELMGLYDLESRLLPLLHAMRKRGVRVDIPRAERVREELMESVRTAHELLNNAAGNEVDPWAATSVAVAFDRANLPYPSTAGGEPSFTADWLSKHEHPIAQAVATYRKYDKALGTFINGYVFDKHVNGVIHGEFHPLRRAMEEDGIRGAVSGRFSSSNPNLQNIPSRDPEIGPMVRGLFVPFEGDVAWRRYDYSQIEYRYLVHYAMGVGADDARARFCNDPGTDYHEFVRQLIREITGILLERKPTKNINFGLCYGMGKKKLIRSLGVTTEVGNSMFDAYHEGVPFVRTTFNRVMNRALARGWIRTILGRRARFDMWEPVDWELKKHVKATLDKRELIDTIAELREIQRLNGEKVPRAGIQRAFGHKALNRLLQGGAADMMKKGMVDCWESGAFDATGVPLVTVHDELGFSDPGTPASEEGFGEVAHIMETCLPLRVPVLVDCEVGPSWGEVA
jgi:DNA polymerase I-like protein with 3'-5' exonuclease and polymerase domains